MCPHSTGTIINKYVLLNENQFDFMCRIIVRGRAHEQMVQFKLDVTKAFSKK
ncbi:hypothetical protein [Proteus penneri]|uniref:hypothetical protein n=1 Tax=Proteus penneri TaxID=102862 RepID=UPI002150D2CF|nr:hypothetical protein [Proteus penneri]